MLDDDYLIVKKLKDPRIKKSINHPLSFTLKKKESLVLKGRNGSGKTSLIRILKGIYKLTEGELQATQSVSFLPYQTPLYQNVRVTDYISNFKHPFIKFLSDKKDEFIKNLSAGQQRAIALFISMKPHKKLWIFDEPTVFLDTHQKKLFSNIVEQHISQSGAIIWSTHDLNDQAIHEIAL